MSADGWVCVEHGLVLHAKWRSNVELAAVMFCPYCNRELFRDDLLGEIERGGRQPVTLDEWKSAQ